jgi:molecular chaperone HscB
LNYFEYYGLEASFVVDKKALRKAYLDKSRQVHPDISDQDIGDEHSASFNNEAYTILNDDMALVKYMLDIHDMPIDAKNAPMPQDFLLEMMDLNEAIDEVQSNGGSADECKVQIESIQSQIIERHKAELLSFTPSMTETQKHEILVQARNYFLKMNYVKRLYENLNGTQSI